MIPRPGPQRPVLHRERHGDPDRPGGEPAVAEQRDPVHRDRDQARERGVLVHRGEDLRQPGLADRLAGHREPQRHRERDQQQRHDAGGPAREPPPELHGVAAGHAATPRPFGPEPPAPAAPARHESARRTRRAGSAPARDRPAGPAAPARPSSRGRPRGSARRRGAGAARGLATGRPAARPWRAPRPRPRSGRRRWRSGRRSRPGGRSRGRSGGGPTVPPVSHSRASMPDVATAPPCSSSTAASPPPSGWRTSTAWSPCTRMSPPQSTAHGPAGASSAATRSAMKPLALPPRSSRRPGGRVIVRSPTVTRRYRAAGSGAAARRAGAPASAGPSAARGRAVSERA